MNMRAEEVSVLAVDELDSQLEICATNSFESHEPFLVFRRISPEPRDAPLLLWIGSLMNRCIMILRGSSGSFQQETACLP